MIKSEFYIEFRKFEQLFNEATDWLINSWEHKKNSEDYQICLLKHQKYHKKALKHLKKANKYLNG
jgi:hypothetical protein